MQRQVDSDNYAVNTATLQEDPATNLKGWIKTRGSLVPGREVVYWFTGDIHAYVDNGGATRLFRFEGYNIGRCVPQEGGWRLLTREVGLYRDAQTGEILHGEWQNPFTNRSNEVVHVWNDPVNQEFSLVNRRTGRPFLVPTTRSGKDIYWHMELFLRYPNPLPRSEFPESSASNLYQSAELFQFFCEESDLADARLDSAPCQLSWVRVSQWLPWMNMGSRPGRLVYHCRGKKLEHGFANLPEDVRAYVQREHPEYQQAPQAFTAPNETSWTYFRKMITEKGAPRIDGSVAAPDAPPSTPPTPRRLSPLDQAPALRRFTRADLAQYDGSDADRGIYISVNRRVFDVTSGARNYGRGQPYNVLAGRDASKALVRADLSPRWLDLNEPLIVIDDLNEDERAVLEHWTRYFADSYPEIGYLV